MQGPPVEPQAGQIARGKAHLGRHHRARLESDLRRAPVEQQRAAGGHERDDTIGAIKLAQRHQPGERVDLLLAQILQGRCFLPGAARGKDARVEPADLGEPRVELIDRPCDLRIGAAAQACDLLRCGVERAEKAAGLLQHAVEPQLVLRPGRGGGERRL